MKFVSQELSKGCVDIDAHSGLPKGWVDDDESGAVRDPKEGGRTQVEATHKMRMIY